MSRHHRSTTNEVEHLILDAKNLSHSEMIKIYNVEVWEDGQVYDLTADKMYATVKEWANATVEEDVDDFEHSDLYDTEWDDE